MAAVELSKSMNDKLTRVYVGNIVLWFSYETIVAYHVPGDGRKVSVNVWGTATGKHLNAIDGGTKDAKAERIPHGEFVRGLEAVMDRIERATAAA